MIAGRDTLEDSVERVLQSRTFRNSPSSRRLLKYLFDRAAANDADRLKEYTIGVDAFGKPPGYDPRTDSTVRIQVGRLRQRLADYYSAEGQEDPVVLRLPKGGFSLVCDPRPEGFEPSSLVEEEPETVPREPVAVPAGNLWRRVSLVLASLLVAALLVAGYTLLKTRSAGPVWTPELARLWDPLLKSGRPLIITVGNPLFMEFPNEVLYRDRSIETPEGLLKSPSLDALRKALGKPEGRAVHYYAAVGDVTSAFRLGQRLGPQQTNISVVRSSQLQWQQLADANVIFLGPPRFFREKLGNLPAALEITETAAGFEVQHPGPDEPKLYEFRNPPGFLEEDGDACVLITHTAGPAGNTDVITFASNSTFGRAGAVSAFTDPAFAKVLAAKMRGANGRFARYYQVLLRVKYKGGVPTETSFLLYRELKSGT